MIDAGNSKSRSTRRRGARRLVIAAAAVAAMVTLTQFTASQEPANAATVAVTVDTSTVTQPDFLGVGAVYHGFSYMPESTASGMTDSLRELDFDRAQGLDLHIARTWYGSDWAMPTWGGSYDWNSTKMTAFYQWLQAMKDRGVDVALNFGWWFPQNTCSADQPNDPTSCTPQVPGDVNTFSHWVSDSIHELVQVKGFTNVKYGLMFTEPLLNTYGNLPAGYTLDSYYDLVAHSVDAQLTSDGRRGLIQLVGPDSTNLNTTTAPLAHAVANLNDVFDIYSSHTYSLAGYSDWASAVQSGETAIASTGKPFWLDEYGKSVESYRNTGDYGTYIAQANAGAINAGAQTTLMWLYEDQQYVWPLDTTTNSDSFYDGIHKWGTQPWLPTATDVRPSWYVFSMMSKFLGGTGTQVHATSGIVGGVTTTATRLPDGQWSVMLVNTNSTSTSATINFSSALNKTLYAHVYDPAHPPTTNAVIGTSAVYNSVGSTMNVSLPAGAVAIYTSENDGTQPGASSDNLAASGTASASSTVSWSNAYGASNLNDQNLSDFWTSSLLAGPAADQSATVDLGSQTPFQNVVLYPRVSGGQSLAFPQDFSIQGSNDNSTWTTLATEKGAGIPAPGTGLSVTVGNQSFRYLRVHVTTARADGANYYAQLAEIEVYNQSASTGKPVTISSSAPGVFGSNLSNGNLSDFWSSSLQAGPTVNQAAYIDLGSTTPVHQVVLYPRLYKNQSVGFPVDFTIEGSNNGSTWTTLTTETGAAVPAPGTSLVVDLGSQNYRYVQIHVTKTRTDGTTDYYTQLAEFQVR